MKNSLHKWAFISIFPTMDNVVKFIDLFCGVGGFRYAAQLACKESKISATFTLSSDIDVYCQDSYAHNFGHRPLGDIAKIDAKDVPDHDVLLAGFPCQPFSIIGSRKGLDDARGTLFFEIARIAKEKHPSALVLENVKMLEKHDNGRTLRRIYEVLREMDYDVDHRILNALDFGLPQKRERIFIVAIKKGYSFNWPSKVIKTKTLSEILESDVDEKHYVSDYILKKRLQFGTPNGVPMIWHENKSGNVSIRPYSCALRAGGSYNYLLVDGKRRLTPREMFRLQGYPESFKIVCNDSQSRKQAGNSLPVPMAKAVIKCVLNALTQAEFQNYKFTDNQMRLFERKVKYDSKTKIKNCRKILA
jgi:DNA (cytosine-5)-methyltransferase 1